LDSLNTRLNDGYLSVNSPVPELTARIRLGGRVRVTVRVRVRVSARTTIIKVWVN